MAVTPPTNIGVRARTQTDPGPVQPLAQVREIPADLPELQPGQSFTARIQESLADNTYRAVVTGRQLTLQLPEGAKPGETLELVVVDRTPKTLIARRADIPTAAASLEQAYPYAKISSAGQMIGQLLSTNGEAPQAAPLNRGQPLLPQAPRTGAELAATLEKAVGQSGLFYESHQAQWVAGQRSLESLRAEPQGQLPVLPRPTLPQASTPLAHLPVSLSQPGEPEPPLTYDPHAQTAKPSATIGRQDAMPESMSQASTPARPEGMPEAANPTRTEAMANGQNRPASSERIAAASTTTPGATPQTIPEEVRPIVQQQLDAVATQRLAWHGEVWPGQSMAWTVEQERSGERETAPGGGDDSRWITSLSLSMPRLGALEATLELANAGLRLHLRAKDENAANDLRGQVPSLTRALADAGLTLQSIDIRREA